MTQLQKSVVLTVSLAVLVAAAVAVGVSLAMQPARSRPAAEATTPAEEQPRVATEKPSPYAEAVGSSSGERAGAARTEEAMNQIPASVTVYPDRAAVVGKPAATTTGMSAGVGDGSADAAIRETLQRWSTAMVKNDPSAEAAEYAPHLDKYFLRSGVDQAFVEADKRAYLKRGNITADFTLRDVRIENETANTAEVRLTKDVTWQRAGGSTHKLIRSLLHLQRFGDGWKITGEQDFK